MKVQRAFFLMIFFFSLLVPNLGNGQNVFPSYTDIAKWSVLECTYGIGYSCNTYSAQYNFDTSLCGQIYSKAILDGVMCNGVLYVRSDSLRTYCRKSTNCSDREYLMYDYSMLPGDTSYFGFQFYASPPMEDSTEFILDSINTTIINGVARQVFHMRYNVMPDDINPNFQQMKMIKGIGSLTHPFFPLACLHEGCEASSVLLCYDSAQTQLYIDAFMNTCDTSYSDVSMSDISSSYLLSIFPDPFSEEVTVSVGNAVISKVSIFDVLGECICEVNGNKQNSILLTSSGKIQAGIYFIRVQTDKGILTKKVIKK